MAYGKGTKGKPKGKGKGTKRIKLGQKMGSK